MKGLSNLIAVSSPSIVAIQSGVLVLFMLCFVVVLLRMCKSGQKEYAQKVGERALKD